MFNKNIVKINMDTPNQGHTCACEDHCVICAYEYEQQESEYEEHRAAWEMEQNVVWMLEQAFLAGLKPEDFAVVDATFFEVDVLPF